MPAKASKSNLMKKNYSTILMWILAIPILFTLFSYSNGYATTKHEGITGAPGDRTTASGTPVTCQKCHDAPDHYQASLDIFATDANGHKILGYAPGATYKVHFKINHAVNIPAKYGFLAVGLLDSDNSGLQNFTGYSANVKEIVGILGRKYYEHNNPSTNNEFTVDWVAPNAGKGSVTFYGVGNATDGKNTQSGDSPCQNTLKLTEGLLLSNKTPIRLDGVQVMGNPSRDVIQISLLNQVPGDAHVRLFDLNGHQVLAQKKQLSAGQNEMELNVGHLSSGAYILSIQTKKGQVAKKVLLMD